MRRNDWRFRNVERIAHRLIRNVGDVNKHSQPVHLANNFFAKRREAMMFLLAASGVGPVARVVPGKRHVANAETMNRKRSLPELFVALRLRGDRGGDDYDKND